MSIIYTASSHVLVVQHRDRGSAKSIGCKFVIDYEFETGKLSSQSSLTPDFPKHYLWYLTVWYNSRL